MTPAEQQDLKRVVAQSPVARWAYRDVTFRVPDADTPVLHDFKGVDPETIRWVPLQVEGDAYLYQAIGTRQAATSTHIWLRASAPARARLLLICEHPL